MVKKIIVISIMLLLLSNCTSEQEKRKNDLTELSRTVKTELQLLGDRLNQEALRNAKLINIYAATVKRDKPDMSELLDALAQDATTKGTSYTNLKKRLEDANGQIPIAIRTGNGTYQLHSEFMRLITATNPENFDLMLSDPLNAIADMSDGKLPRVESLSKQASLRMNGASDYGSGSQLIGNPSYGQWREDSSGNSVWAWLGPYMLFSSLTSRPYYYNSWASRRDYSYYHDYGRTNYSSPEQIKKQQTLETRTKKKFAEKGTRFTSPYASKKSTTSTVASKRALAANSLATRSARKSSGRSSYNSSYRSSSYGSRSRGWGGK